MSRRALLIWAIGSFAAILLVDKFVIGLNGHQTLVSAAIISVIAPAGEAAKGRQRERKLHGRPFAMRQVGFQRNGQEQLEVLVRLLLEPVNRRLRQKLLGLIGSK